MTHPCRSIRGHSTCPELPRCLRPTLPLSNKAIQYLQACRRRVECLPFAVRRKTRLRKNKASVIGLGLNATETVLIIRHFPAPGESGRVLSWALEYCAPAPNCALLLPHSPVVACQQFSLIVHQQQSRPPGVKPAGKNLSTPCIPE